MAFDNFFCHAFLQRPQATGGIDMPSMPFTSPKAPPSPLQQKIASDVTGKGRFSNIKFLEWKLKVFNLKMNR
jgi:hypothetical protein